MGKKRPVFNFVNGEKHDFGELEPGPDATYDFEFINTGNAPLEIIHASSICGCFGLVWTRGAIPPGKKGKITVIYETGEHPGEFIKEINVLSNATDTPYHLHITGRVGATQPR
jgi:hypothetical protein